MPGVPSVGTVDYNNNLYQQPQNVEEQQIPVEAEQIPVDISQQMPVDYSAELESTKKSGSLAGPIILGLALLGITGFCGYKYGGKNLAKKLDALNNSEAVKNYNSLKEQHDNLKNATNELLETAENSKFHIFKPWTWNKKFINKVKEKLSPFKKVEENITEETKKAADGIKEAAEAKKAADDTAKNAA